MRLPLAVIIVLGLSAALPGGVATRPVRAQSLGDLARQEAERRKTLKPPEKIITNKDVPRVSQPEPPAPAANAAAPSAATPADGADKPKADGTSPATPDGDVKDQKYWSDRLKGLHDVLERDQSFALALQSRINALTTDFVNRDDPSQRAVIANDRQKALDDMARLNTTIEMDKKAIADFEDEARRAAVPPGWLR